MNGGVYISFAGDLKRFYNVDSITLLTCGTKVFAASAS